MSDLISRQAAIDALHMDTSIIPFKKAREYADATISEIRNRLEKLPSAQPERMSNREWVNFLCRQFDISRTSAKEMLHDMMQMKREDNFKSSLAEGVKK